MFKFSDYFEKTAGKEAELYKKLKPFVEEAVNARTMDDVANLGIKYKNIIEQNPKLTEADFTTVLFSGLQGNKDLSMSRWLAPLIEKGIKNKDKRVLDIIGSH